MTGNIIARFPPNFILVTAHRTDAKGGERHGPAFTKFCKGSWGGQGSNCTVKSLLNILALFSISTLSQTAFIYLWSMGAYPSCSSLAIDVVNVH